MSNFVLTDLHGSASAFEAIKKIARPDDTLYFLGDAIDRGPVGYEIAKWLLARPNTIYLKGNHEDMFVRAARAIKNYQMDHQCAISKGILRDLEYHDVDVALSYYNGGHDTLIGWIQDGMPMDIVNKMDKLPVKFSYNEFDMCHAGCLPEQWDADNEQEMIWNRNHFMAPWKDGRILIHGHTPIDSLYEDFLSFFAKDYSAHTVDADKIYGGAHYNEDKIDLDFGTIYTGICAIYNLDNHRLEII